MEIKAKITGIKYDKHLETNLNSVKFSEFEINDISSAAVINDDNFSFGISKWVSPKRTRSYPYERVYNTLTTSKRVTVIPVIKDEGKNGDRDFIQWDTVSLMSLLDVFVIFAYYTDAEKHTKKNNKITNQKFDNTYIKSKINEIKNYHSSALHWNLKEIETTLPVLIEKVKVSYKRLNQKLKIEFHSFVGIDKFLKNFTDGVETFIKSSRKKAKEAQNRESLTVQPKELLTTSTKAKITIENYLGGKYYFTTDEIKIFKNKIYIIEAKHTASSLLPSIGDIKDGLLKMILYTNLVNVSVDNKILLPKPVLKLTSKKIKNNFSSDLIKKEKLKFFSQNSFSEKQQKLLELLFLEAKNNGFIIELSSK